MAAALRLLAGEPARPRRLQRLHARPADPLVPAGQRRPLPDRPLPRHRRARHLRRRLQHHAGARRASSAARCSGSSRPRSRASRTSRSGSPPRGRASRALLAVVSRAGARRARSSWRPDFVPLVLGDQWTEAVPVIQILAWVGIVQALQALNMDILMARGRSRTMFRFAIVADHVPPGRLRRRPPVGRHRRRRRLRGLDHAGRAGPDGAGRARASASRRWSSCAPSRASSRPRSACAWPSSRSGWRSSTPASRPLPARALHRSPGAVVYGALCLWRVPEVAAEVRDAAATVARGAPRRSWRRPPRADVALECAA